MLSQGNDECNSYDEWCLEYTFWPIRHTKLEFCFVFVMQRLVKGWCFPCKGWYQHPPLLFTLMFPYFFYFYSIIMSLLKNGNVFF